MNYGKKEKRTMSVKGKKPKIERQDPPTPKATLLRTRLRKGKAARQGKVRFVTATTLFDGHDASINVFRRLLQRAGAEVIHLGHNRSAKEIVYTAIQEGVHAIAVSSYQGGHIEFFKYVRDLLDENGVGFIKIFGGGGGVIIPEEIRELEDYGITKIYSPEDGQRLFLRG